MYPIVFFLGNAYPTFTIFGLVGFFVAIVVAGFRAKKYGLTRSDPLYIGTFAGLGLLLGSSLLFALIHTPQMWAYRAYLLTDFTGYMARFFGGMVFYGGLFGAIGGIFAYCKIMKQPLGVVMKLTIPVLPLAHAIMRVGCFMAGCCHGIQHQCGIVFTRALGAPNNIPLLPVQLYEAAVNLGIFAMLWVFTKRERSWKTTACLYGIAYSIVRFFLEFLRGDAGRGFVFGFSTSQIISAGVFLGCVVWLITQLRAIKTN